MPADFVVCTGYIGKSQANNQRVQGFYFTILFDSKTVCYSLKEYITVWEQ
jgi:hypothetical protein